MKYDDASWHYEGNFPSDLPPQNGSTHIAMFFAWAAENDLLSKEHKAEYAHELNDLSKHIRNYRDYFESICDEKLVDDDLNETGNMFAKKYYENQYFNDYMSVFEFDGPTLYHVKPTWENYDRLRPILQDRFTAWLNGRNR